MVNRGSTSQALALDHMQDDQEEQGLGNGAMFSTLKFGWNAIFSDSGASKAMSDAELDRLIDRTRGIECGKTARENSISPNTTCALLENQECTLQDFEESAPMVKLREFGGSFVSRGEEISDSIVGIADEWKQIKQQRRDNAQRCESVRVSNVGMVAVLKSNQYTLESGEVSVYQKELKGVAAMKDTKRKAEVYEICAYFYLKYVEIRKSRHLSVLLGRRKFDLLLTLSGILPLALRWLGFYSTRRIQMPTSSRLCHVWCAIPSSQLHVSM